MALIVTSALMTDELPHVTTSLIEMLTDAEVEEIILETDVHEVTYLMNSLQEEVKKLVGRGELKSSCDDNEEEIAQFDGETVKKVMINEASTFLSTVNNLKAPPERFWLGGDKYRVTRTDEIPNAYLVLTHC